MAQRVGDGIPERRRDRNLGRVTVGVIQRHRAAAARVIDVDRVRRDEYSLGGERRAGAPLAAQGVLVAPHAIYIDHARRSGTVTLYNPNRDAAEVTISTAFGYPVTDSLGHFALRTVDQPDSTLPSAAAWVQAFPRRLTIAPLQRQTVRLLATPPAGLPDGEYWARLIISA